MAKKQTTARVKDSNVSPFLGIGEGRIAAAKGEADAARTAAEANAKMVDALIAQATGYNAAKATTDTAALAATQAAATDTTKTKYTLYLVIGAVLILMVGLYFIVKRVKK